MKLIDGTNIISVIVKPNSKKEAIDFLPEGTIRLSIKERPVENAANEAVIKKIADFFNLPKSKVVIKTGLHSKKKIVIVSN